MKILFFIDNLGSGGAQSQFVLLGLIFKKLGYEVEFFTYFDNDFFAGILEKNNITCTCHKKKGKLGLNVIYSYSKFLSKIKPDIVISQLSTPNFYASLGGLLSFYKHKLLIIHGSKTNFSQLSIRKKIELFIMNYLSDVVICNSHHERKNMQKIYPTLNDKIHTIYNSVNFDRFKFSKRDKKTNKLLVVASVSKYKKGLDIIEAINILKNQNNINFTLTWIGRKEYFASDTESYFDRMEKKIKEYELEDIWEWQEPIVDIENIYPLYDGLLLASDVEGLPNVVCEAMASGLPILISNTLDHPLLIEHGINGLLFEVNNPISLANTIRLFNSLSLETIQNMGYQNTQKAKVLFDKEHLLSQYFELFGLN